jgi:endonuclease/exonuclease/phosphatase (EEP) superfamily protein YafD
MTGPGSDASELPAPAADDDASPRRRVRSLLVRLTWACTVVAVLLLAFSYLLPQDLRRTGRLYTPAVALAFYGRTFTFHTGVALVVAAVVGAALRRRRLGLFAFVASMVALTPTAWSYAPKDSPPPAPDAPNLRVMSMNLYVANRNAAKIVAQIRAADPDVIVLQEFTPFAQTVLQSAFADRDYPHRFLMPQLDPSGNAVYSRLPFVERPSPDQSTGTTGRSERIRAVISVGGRPVVIYAVHPASPGSVHAIWLNRQQTANLLERVRQEDEPVLVAGDFNFTDEAANATALRGAGLVSAHDLAGTGRDSTWPFAPTSRRYLPGVRIDHVFLDRRLTCTKFGVAGDSGSDHRPIVADVAFRAERSDAPAR